MQCLQCGRWFPGESESCPDCEQSSGADGDTHPEGQWEEWETCEITSEGSGIAWLITEFHFVAYATGPRGEYSAARSGTFPATPGYPIPIDASDPRANAALAEVVQALMAAGWKPLPRGEHWFSFRFYRQVES
ncbi:hypothetical protein [Nitrolancea hollandica]|uniref:Uncharacterized protein n=1 Tax=Nitrolancea hollandica Lb TaxID=1129897 RepID=I4EHD0_9BACT|nr:hypothetical protein [Nitrolancea hollandica]CCF84092.1 conserved hypothetical protein [Nitrolancea hollandica Lb]